jgi:hypothetical protein
MVKNVEDRSWNIEKIMFWGEITAGSRREGAKKRSTGFAVCIIIN